MIEERKRLESVLVDFEAFLPSRVHSEYVAATAKDLESVEQRIIEDEITSLSDLFTLLDLRATRRVLKSNLTSFEDTVANLKTRIASMRAAEVTPNATQQDTDNDNEDQPTDDVS